MQKDDSKLVSAVDTAAFQRDGALCLRGLFGDWVERLRQGVAANEADPGPFAEDAAPGDLAAILLRIVYVRSCSDNRLLLVGTGSFRNRGDFQH